MESVKTVSRINYRKSPKTKKMEKKRIADSVRVKDDEIPSIPIIEKGLNIAMSNGTLLAHVEADMPYRRGDKIATNLVCHFYDCVSAEAKVVNIPYSFPKELIFRCVPEGVNRKLLYHKVAEHRTECLERLKKSIEDNMVIMSPGLKQESQCLTLMRLFQGELDKQFSKTLTSYVKFEVIFEVLISVKKYR